MCPFHGYAFWTKRANRGEWTLFGSVPKHSQSKHISLCIVKMVKRFLFLERSNPISLLASFVPKTSSIDLLSPSSVSMAAAHRSSCEKLGMKSANAGTLFSWFQKLSNERNAWADSSSSCLWNMRHTNNVPKANVLINCQTIFCSYLYGMSCFLCITVCCVGPSTPAFVFGKNPCSACLNSFSHQKEPFSYGFQEKRRETTAFESSTSKKHRS